jgi:ssDNA-binding Zn-finger/Zn-ribbon topoisomerase 1
MSKFEAGQVVWRNDIVWGGDETKAVVLRSRPNAKKYRNKNAQHWVVDAQIRRGLVLMASPDTRRSYTEVVHEDKLSAVHTPKCPTCQDELVVKRNYKGCYFWGCHKFPTCRGTRNLWDVEKVTNNTESDTKEMAQLISNKWYILRKPKAPYRQQLGTVTLFWDNSKMDEMDGMIAKCAHVAYEGWGQFEADDHVIHGYAIHPDWAEGPFETKEDALRSKIKVTLTKDSDRDVEKEIEDFANGRIEFFKTAVPVKLDKQEVHLQDPETKIVSVENKDRLVDNVDHYKLIKELEGKVEYLEQKLNEKASLPTLDERWNPLMQDEDINIPIREKSKFQKDVDKIFENYHERNARRDALEERFNQEFEDKGKSRGRGLYKVLAVTGSVTAIAWSGWTLLPYLLLVL